MREGIAEEDYQVGVQVRLRFGAIGEIIDIDPVMESMTIRIPHHLPILYNLDGSHGTDKNYDILSLVPEAGYMDIISERKYEELKYEKLEYTRIPTIADMQYLPPIEDDEDEPVEEPLPDWAIAKSDAFDLEIGLQLFTRDGSKVGNGVIIDMRFNIVRREPLFVVVTDAGSLMKLNLNELLSYYAKGKYIINDYLPAVRERANRYFNGQD